MGGIFFSEIGRRGERSGGVQNETSSIDRIEM